MDEKGIARALRESLTGMGHDISHSQALELVAKTIGLKNWNVLSAQVSPSRNDGPGFFCPKCGRKDGVSIVANAFVEQGPGDGEEYLFEGDCVHYGCSHCGNQFLDWNSDWPGFNADSRQLIIVTEGHRSNSHMALLVPLGPLRAITEHEDDFYGMSEEAHVLALVAHAQAEARGKSDLSFGLYGLLSRYGIGPSKTGQAHSVADAVQKLLGSLDEQERLQVVNRDIASVA